MAFPLILPRIARFEGFSLDWWMAPLSPFDPRVMILTDLLRTQRKELRCLYLLESPLLDLLHDVQLLSCLFLSSHPLCKEHPDLSQGQP